MVGMIQGERERIMVRLGHALRGGGGGGGNGGGGEGRVSLTSATSSGRRLFFIKNLLKKKWRHPSPPIYRWKEG